jgi:PDZ domain-containing protein
MKNSSTKPAKLRHFPKFKLGLTWLIVVPGIPWALITYFLPLMGGTLNQTETRLTTPISIVLIAMSLFLHVFAHLWAARWLGIEKPSEVPVLIFGDTAQRWSTTELGWREVLVAAAGPLANFVIGSLAYLLWYLQINDFIGNIALLIAGFNAWMLIINMIPAFPFDGALFVRVSLYSLIARGRDTQLLRKLGYLIATALTGWSIFLYLQHARFSLQTSAITLFLVLLLLDGLRFHPTVEELDVSKPSNNIKVNPWQVAGVGLLVLALSIASVSLLPTNSGLEAPGVSLAIEPMVKIPAQYLHPPSGSFYLVTVISYAPITAGMWALGQVDPAIKIVPPEVVVPRNTTPQEQAKQGYQMLDDSETTAIAVGLQLAGYPATMVGKGVAVVSILPDSHANDILQNGDVITGLNGNPVRTTSDLTQLIQAQHPNAIVRMDIQRGGERLQVSVPLMASASPGDKPKIGIAIASAGFDFKPPFPISIVTQKIDGGPSAGLMFTLTVYNLLSTEDLSGGRKIAGTGTINLDGTVGPIGGVKQKVFAAESVGAKYFLCPVDNYADAVSVAKSIQVVKIATVQQAIDFLKALPAQ